MEDRITPASTTEDAIVNMSGTDLGVVSVAVADYRDDWQAGTPRPGWSYQVNGGGAGNVIGNSAGYQNLLWRAPGSHYTYDGVNYPTGNPGQYVALGANGGHPGPGVSEGATIDRYAIAGYTVSATGGYSITNSFVNRTAGTGQLEVRVYVGDTQKLVATQNVANQSFDVDLGIVNAGQRIYVAIGPRGSHGSDSFALDFTITQSAYITALGSGASTLGAPLSLSNGVVTYNPTATASLQALDYGSSASDSVSVTYSVPGGGTATASIPVTVIGLPDPPDAKPDSATTAIDTPIAIDVLTNDTITGLVMADYRDDFQGPTPKLGWSYKWNSAGAIGTAANYTPLSWTGAGTYDGDGVPGLPAGGPAQYVFFSATNVHPGGGTAQGAGVDRYAVAEYAVPVTGRYSITDSSFRHSDMAGGPVDLRVYVDNALLFSSVLPQTASVTPFDMALGVLSAGQKIYVCVGPSGDHGNDNSSIDFTIRLNSAPTITSVPATSAMGATLTFSGGGTIGYDPTTSASAALIGPGQSAVDTFQYTVDEPGVGTKTATVSVTLLGVFNNNMNQSGTGGNDGSPDVIKVMLAPGGAQRQVFVNDVLFSQLPVTSGALTFTGSADDDTLIVDFTNGNPIPAGGINYAGGAGFDGLTLTGGSTTTVTHNAVSSSAGAIVLAGSIAGTITYTGLEPIDDNMNAVDRVFNFTGGTSAVPGLIHQWTFNDLADTTPNDSVGTAHGTLFNGAAVVSGGAGQGLLSLDGVNDYMRTSTVDATITTKTLVAWVRLNNLGQRSGSALTLENPTGGDVFDGIVYGERVPNQWMNGSNGFTRTPPDNGGPAETLADPNEVMIAIAYAADNSITLYRDGVLYGSYTLGTLQSYAGGIADVLIGVRHADIAGGSGTAGGNDAFLAGLINEARIYGAALTPAQVMQIYIEGPVVGTVTTDEVITLTDAAGAAMTIDSNFSESITFANPTNSITINTGVDTDTLTINSMDPGFTGSLVVDGGSHSDFVNINASVNLASVNITAESISVAAGVTVATTGNQTYNGLLSLNGSTLNPGSASVVIAGGVTTVASASTSVIQGNVGLGGGTRTFTVADGAAADDLAITGVVSNGALTKAGPGTLLLAGANTYAGTTTVSAGTLKLSGGAAIPDGAGRGNVVVAGTLDLNGSSETVNGLSGGGIVTNTGAAATITVGGNDQSSTFTGGFTSALGLTKTGAGTLQIGGASTYTGATNINQGTLKLAPTAPVVGASLKLWLDAADTSSITADGSGFVSQWSDKSGTLGGGGGGTVTQVTAATGNRPVSGNASQSGRNLVRFDGNDGLVGSAILAAGDDDYTYFAVWKPSVATGLQDVFEQNHLPQTGSRRGALLAIGASYGFNGEANDRHDLVPFTAGAWRTTAMEVNNALFDGTNNIRINDNGTQFLGRTGNPANLDLGDGGISVGYKLTTSFGEGLNGDLAEIIVYDSILSAADRQAVLDYLNSKWFGTLPGAFLPTATAVTVAAGATLDTGGSSITIGSLAGAAGGSVAMGQGTLTVGDGASTTFAGVISGSGGLTKTGGGTLTLQGVNTYTGATTINQGTVRVAGSGFSVPVANNSFESPAVSSPNGYQSPAGASWTGGAVVTNTSTLGYSQPASSFGVQAGLIQQTSSISQTINFPVAGTYNLSFSGAIRNCCAGAPNGNPLQVRIDGVVASATVTPPSASYTVVNMTFTVPSAGSHTFTLAGTSTGDRTTFVDNLVITSVDGSTAIPDVSRVTIAGGAFLDLNGLSEIVGSLSGGGTVTNAAATPSTLQVGADNTVGASFGGVIENGSGGIGLGKVGTGTQTLAGANTYTRPTSVVSGTLTLSGGAAMADASDVTVAGTLDVLSSETIGSLAGAGSVTLAGGITLSTGASDATTAFSGSISGAAGLTKVGGGVFTVSGFNTYTGATIVQAGTLRLANSPAVAVGNPSFESPTVSSSNGFQTPAGDSWTGGAVVTNTSTLGYNQPASAFGTQAALIQMTSSITQTMSFPLAGWYNLTFSAAGRNTNGSANPLQIRIDGVNVGSLVTAPINVYTFFSVPFHVASAGNHTVTIAGTSTIDRTTFLDNVVITAALGVPALSPVTVAGGATLDINGTNASVDSIAGTGTITNGSAAAASLTVGINDATGASFGGTIQNGAGTLALTKSGTGDQSLTGNNTYTGATRVSAGTLIVSGGAALPDGSAVTVSTGSTLSVQTSETIASLSGSGDVALASGITLITGVDNTATTFDGVISGANANLVKSGTGVFSLGGINTYGGATEVQNGTLRLLAAPSVTVPNNSFETPVVVAGNGYEATPRAPWTGNSATVTNTSTLGYNQPASAFGTQAALIQQTRILSQVIAFPAAGNYTLSFWAAGRNTNGSANPLAITIDGVQITGLVTAPINVYTLYQIPFAVATAGSHTLTFTGTSTVDRTTFLDNVNITSMLSVPHTSPVTVAGGAVLDLNSGSVSFHTLSGAGTVTNSSTFAANLFLGVNDGTGGDFAGVIQDGNSSVSLTKIGAGTATLSGANTFTGPVAVSAGTLSVAGGAAIADTVNVTVASGGTLDVAASEVIGSLAGPAGSAVTIAGGAVLDVGGNGASTTFGGAASGAGGLTKSGAGTFTVSGNNTYSGPTNISQGTITLAAPAAVTAGANFNMESPQGPFNTAAPDFATNAGFWYNVPAAQGSWTFTGSGLARSGSAFNLPSNNAHGGTQVMFLQGAGVASQSLALVPGYYTLSFWAAFRNGGVGVNPLNITIGSTTLFSNFSPASNTVWTNYTVNFTITAAGSYPLTFTGVNPGGDRTSFIDTISLTGVPSGVSSNYLPDNSTVTVASGAFLEMSGQSEAIGSLQGGGTVTSTAPVAVTLTVGGDNLASADFTGVLQNGPTPGTLGLHKTGTGTQTLSGANTYTGGTLITGGTLLVDGSLADGPAATDVTVGSNTTFGGSGTVAGTVSIANLGHLAPGSSVGTLTLSNTAASVVFSLGATFDVEFDGTAMDQAVVSTLPSLAGVTLNLAYIGPASPPSIGTYVIIDNLTSSPFITTFNGLPEGTQVPVSGANWPAGSSAFITYTAGTGNDVGITIFNLNANPDPVAFPDSNYEVVQNTTLTTGAANGVLANDEGAPLSVLSFSTTSANGATVIVNADGSFTYDPRTAPALVALAAGEVLTDTFQYTATNAADNNPVFNTGSPGVAQPGLLSGDLTDPENDGNPEANVNYNATFFSSVEPGFGGGEFAFNVFDNQVGGNNMKWCCDVPVQWVAAQFSQAYILTHFSISSGNDAPERRPDIWQIQGSNDSTNGGNGTWMPIYTYSNDGTSPFTADNQTLLYTSSQGRTDLTGGATQFDSGARGFTWFRYIVMSTQGNTIHQLGELEFFGVPAPVVGASTATVSIQVTGVNDAPIAVNDPPSFPNVNYTTDEETTLTTSAANGLLVNDSDPDNGSTITVASASATSTMGATVTVGATGSVTYDPTAAAAVQALGEGQVATDTFTYTIVDGVVVPANSNTGSPGAVRPGLLGGDLTDPENDGDPAANVNYNANFFASSEPSFDGPTEAAFNVFDNQVGGGAAKWCCATPNQWVAAQFNQPYVLTHFTITSGNDSPERRPDIWQIQGSSNSTDGNNGAWATIYSYNNSGTSPFTANDQTLLYTSSQGRTDLTGGATQFETGGQSFTWFRYIVFSTQGDTIHQLGELEFFGIPPTSVLSASATVSIRVTGVNDAPVGVADSNAVIEAVDSTAGTPVSGNVLTNDTDPDDPVSQFTVTTPGTFTGAYGTLVLNANGTYTYTLDNANPAVNALNVGGTLSESFPYTLSDNHPSGNVKTGSSTMTITISGANDTPVPSDNLAAVTEDTALVDSGNLLTDDDGFGPDIDDSSPLFVGTVNGDTSTTVAGAYGTLAWNTNGNYTYTLSNSLPAVQALAAGATATDTFTYTAAEGLFATATPNTNTGSPGAARPGLLGGDLTDPENNGDPENNFNYNASFFASDEPGFGGGEFAFNVFDNRTGGGNDKWCCIAPAPSQWVAAQFNQPYVLTHFTITSGNDSPVRRPDIWQIQGSSNSTNGADGTWTSIYSYNNNGTSPFSADSQTLLFTSSEGRTDLTGGATQYETAGQSFSWFRYIVFSTEGDTIHQLGELEFFGIPQVRSASAALTVTVTGTNDVPTLGGTNAGTVTEDGTLSAAGTLTINDVDTGESTYVPQTNVAGTYGTFTLAAGGAWTYTLNNSAAVVQALAGGQSVIDGFTAVSFDGSASRPVAITVNGAVDDPVLSAPASPLVTVDEGSDANNSGTFTDIDATDDVAITATIAGVPVGTVNKTGTNNGSWTWTYNTTNGPAQSGTVTITADDGLGGISTTTFQLVVNNVAPAFTLPASAALTLADSGVFSLPDVPFIDPGADVWVGKADFGDGSGVMPVSVNQGAKTFSLLHAYQFGGTYTVTVTIDDQDPAGATTHTMTVTVPQPTQTYADDDWTGFANGVSITDADPVAAGDQPAVFGYDAFASPHIAILAVAPSGSVTVNAGTYHETATIGKTVSVNFQEGPILIGSLSDTVSTAVLTLSGITLSLGAGSLSSPVGGTGGIEKIGAGTFTFTGAVANTYSGTTTVTDGTLALARTGAQSVVGDIVIGDGNNNGQPANVKTAILRVANSHQIDDASAISFVGGDGRLHIAAGATETIAAPTFAAGDVKIAGTLTTDGEYVQTGGSTTLAGGTLRVGPGGTLNSSITGTLQGSGTIYTNILTNYGTIDPSSGITDADFGNASPGFLNIRGNLQMTASSITNLDVGSPLSDQLNVGINTALQLPAGSYITDLSNYDLDPYLRGDVASVTEQSRRGVNDIRNVNGTVRFHGTLNVRPIASYTPANNVSHGNSMNFVWRALNLPMGAPHGDMNPKNGNLSSVPSDFTARNSYTATGTLIDPAGPTGTRFEARFMGSAGQANAVGQAVATMTKIAGVSTAVLTAPAFNVGQAKSLTLTSLAAPASGNSSLRVTKQLWNANKDSHTRVTVTVGNTGTSALTGPFYLELTSIPNGATVFNANGKTQANRPYLVVIPRDAAGNALSTLAPGATATVEVDLLTPITLGKYSSIGANLLLGGLP